MWNQQTNAILEKIRLNSIKLSNKHRQTALSIQHSSRYFDLPVIVMSVVSSSMGSNEYVPEKDKNSVNLFISMIVTILTSIKLYLNINNSLNQEISLSREYYVLSIDIYKNLNMPLEVRPDPTQFLNECYSQYVKLIEQSTLNNKIKKDELIRIEAYENEEDTLSSSSSSGSSTSTPTNVKSYLQERRNILITEMEEL